MTHMKRFGDQLRAYRIALGLTQIEFGKKVNMKASNVSYWERAERPSARLIAHLRNNASAEISNWITNDFHTNGGAA